MGFTDWLWGTGGGGDSGAGTALDWVKFLTQYQQAKSPPKSYNVPQSPQQADLYNWALPKLKALPDTSALYPMAVSRAMTSPSFDVDAAKAGRTAYSHGTPPSPEQLAGIIGQHPTGTTGGQGGGTGGGATTSNPGGMFGDPFASANQSIPNGGMPPGINSPGDWGTFTEFMKTYGRAAGEGLLAILAGNPAMGIRAAIDAWHAYSQSQATNQAGNTIGSNLGNTINQNFTPQLGQWGGNPNPTGAQWTVPGTPGSGINDITNGQQPVDWGKYYDPMAGAQGASDALSSQDSSYWGRPRAR